MWRPEVIRIVFVSQELFIVICVCVCVLPAMVHVWKSEDNFMELVLLFSLYVCPGHGA